MIDFVPPIPVDIALIVVGLLMLLARLLPARTPVPVALDLARERAQLAHQLGLGHRLAARLLQSRSRPADENFVAVAELYQLSATATGITVLGAYTQPALPLLAVEQLLERMESLMARARAWRPRGRARGQR